MVKRSSRGAVLVDGHSSEAFDLRGVHILPTTSANTWLPTCSLSSATCALTYRYCNRPPEVVHKTRLLHCAFQHHNSCTELYKEIAACLVLGPYVNLALFQLVYIWPKSCTEIEYPVQDNLPLPQRAKCE